MIKSVLAILTLFLFSCTIKYNPVLTGKENKRLDGFNLLMGDSTIIDTSKIKNNSPFIVIYFSPQCPYCKLETEDILQNISKIDQGNIFMITSFSLDQMKKFYKAYKIEKFKQISMGVDYKNIFYNTYKPSGLPFTLFFNKDKILKKAFIGTLEIDSIINFMHTDK